MSEWEKNLDVTLPNNKEKYFKIAERRIKAAGFEEMLHIDRTQFTASAKSYVKVYLQAVRREKNFRKWQKAMREVAGFTSVTITRRRKKWEEKDIYLRGYIRIEEGDEK